MKARILLVDDHTMMRQSLRKVLETESDFELVGDAENGLTALKMIEKHRPDVVLLDLQMPGLNGLEVVRRVRRGFPRTRVLVLSMHDDWSYVAQALQDGASAYVLKAADVKDLMLAVREVVAGRVYLSPPFTQSDVEAYMKKTTKKTKSSYERLTNREKEVLQLVAEGNTNQQVGKRLGINTRTVETHRAHVMEKLKLQNQAELVRYAAKWGLIPTDNLDAGPAASPPGPNGHGPDASDEGEDPAVDEPQ